MRKLKHLLLILILVPLMFAQYEIPIENLLTNSEFKVWSRADANAGIAALTYDTGSAGGGDIPDVGDAVTGGASGATGKIMSMTIATGTFAGNNATGVIQLGSTTGCFNDDEALAFDDGETAVVNQPDGAVGADKLIKNGAFVHDIDPPNDWTAGAGTTLTTEGAGQVGNCLMIASNGEAASNCHQQFVTEVGKIYKATIYFKKGTGWHADVRVGYNLDSAYYYNADDVSDANWTEYSIVFESDFTNVRFTLIQNQPTTGKTAYFDETTLYEITDGCTGADAKALETWIKDTTVDIYREHNGTNTKDGSFYALKMVVTAASDFVRWPGAFYDKEEWYMQFQGRTVTKGEWVKTSTANHAKLTITDSVGSTSSPYHTGGGAYEWLEVTRTIDGGATSFAVYIYGDVAGTIDGNTIIYASQPHSSFGSSIGSGNYSPKSQEIIWLEKPIPSNLLNGETSKSDVAVANLNLEGDSSAMLGKGCRAIRILTVCNDAASAGTDAYLRFRADATKAYEYYNSLYGLENDCENRIVAWQMCDTSGDIDYNLKASGVGTFDVDEMVYVAVQVN